MKSLKYFIGIILIFSLISSFCSCAYVPDTVSSLPDIEDREWTLITGNCTAFDGLAGFIGVEDGAYFSFTQEEKQIITLSKENGELYLINSSTDEKLLLTYLKLDTSTQIYDYEITVLNNKAFVIMQDCHLRDWDADNTGFDGELYGDYCIELRFESGTTLLFFS